MELIINENGSYLRKHLKHIKNLFKGLDYVEITKIDNDEERCWIEFACDYGVFNESAEFKTDEKYKSNVLAEVLNTLENQIKNIVGEIVEI